MNGSEKSRDYDLPLDYKYLYIYFDYDKSVCKHLNYYRAQENHINYISNMVYNIYYKNLNIDNIPKDDLIKIKFGDLYFNNDDLKNIFNYKFLIK